MRAARRHLYSRVVMGEAQLQGSHYPSAEMRAAISSSEDSITIREGVRQ
jgi:hypothetical protein